MAAVTAATIDAIRTGSAAGGFTTGTGATGAGGLAIGGAGLLLGATGFPPGGIIFAPALPTTAVAAGPGFLGGGGGISSSLSL